jgi:hypothetical protein
MTLINIALQGGDNNTLSTGGIYNGNPPTGTNLLSPAEANGPNWSKDLVPGAYTFQVDATAPAGANLTLAVTNAATNAGPQAVTVPMTGQAGTQVRDIKNVPFTIATDGGVS